MKYPYNKQVQFLPYTSELEGVLGHKFTLTPLATEHIVVSKVVISFPTADFAVLGSLWTDVWVGEDLTRMMGLRIYDRGPHIQDFREGFGSAVIGETVEVNIAVTAPTTIKSRINVIAAGVNSTTTGTIGS